MNLAEESLNTQNNINSHGLFNTLREFEKVTSLPLGPRISVNVKPKRYDNKRFIGVIFKLAKYFKVNLEYMDEGHSVVSGFDRRVELFLIFYNAIVDYVEDEVNAARLSYKLKLRSAKKHKNTVMGSIEEISQKTHKNTIIEISEIILQSFRQRSR